MKYTYLVILCTMVINLPSMGSSVYISGYVKDKNSGEVLIGSTVYCPETKTGTVTNSFGYFSLYAGGKEQIPITISYVGYLRKEITIVNDNKIKYIYLESDNTIDGVVITNQASVGTSRMNRISVNSEQIKASPAILGESDVLRALQTIPGISGGKEGTSGLYVRGGTPDQNLFLLDDVSLYNVNHIGGFLSTFDPDAINDVRIYKAGFPAKYHGRLSSIIDLRLKDGNNTEKHQSFTLGLIAAKYFVEQPVKKDTSSIMFSVRRCNIDLFTRTMSLLVNDFDGMGGYTFYDASFKYNHIINDKNRFYLSLYGGRDRIFFNVWDSGSDYITDYKYKFKSNITWGNYLASLRWNRVYRNNLFGNTTLSFCHFRYQSTNKLKQKELSEGEKTTTNSQHLSLLSGISDLTLKEEFNLDLRDKHKIEFGMNTTLHFYNPGEFSYHYAGDTTTINHNRNITAREINVYLEDRFILSDRLIFYLGLNNSLFNTGKTNFFSVEPRLSSEFQVFKSITFELSYSRMSQSVHLLSNSGTGLPTDLWVPSVKSVQPEKSDQYSFGISYHPLQFTGLYIGLETYIKKLQGLIEMKEGISVFSFSDTWYNKIETMGKGEVLGIEFMLEKKFKKAEGTLGYSYTNNSRLFEHINGGKPYPYHYTRLHDISLVFNYKVNEKVSLSSNWVYGSGFPVTLAYGRFLHEMQYTANTITYEEIHTYDGKNSSRMPDYHRLDLSAHFGKKVRKGERIWSINIYNVYNRQNAYLLFYDIDDKTEQIKLYQLSLFPIIPSFSYSYRF